MSLLALDWNATRLRALVGPAGDYPLPLPLDPPAVDLPTALSLDTNPPTLGAAGLHLCRQAPHLACTRFLPHLGTEGKQAPHWQAKRQSYDAAALTALFWQRLQPLCKSSQGVLLALPGYLSEAQADLLRGLGAKLRLPILGSLPVPLAAALAAHAERFWTSAVVVVDVDDAALSLALVKAVGDQAHLVEARACPHLGLHLWKDRLINAVADLCVRSTRRDPRDSAIAEQHLYEQLDALLDAAVEHRPLHLGIQAQQWYHHVAVQPAEPTAFCGPMLRQTSAALNDLAHSLPEQEFPAGIVLTHAAARLPGLIDAARRLVESWPGPAFDDRGDDDFGEALVPDMAAELGGVLVLPADAPARALHALGAAFRNGDLPPVHLAHLAPLPAPPANDAGPARLHFQGQDYFLRDPAFVLGTQLGCHLRFDPRRYPSVAGRHCEILFDHRTYLLSNRSREGTLVNDHPVAASVVLRAGDWIRLGLDGPTLRFLGQARRHPQVPTTA